MSTLAATLLEGETVSLQIYVADSVEAALDEGSLRPPLLTIRYSYYCVEDTVSVRFNGITLPLAEAEVIEERALKIATVMPGATPDTGVDAPWGMSAHFFTWTLPDGLLKEEWNTLDVTAEQHEPTAGFERAVNGVEILVSYDEWQRPTGIPEEDAIGSVVLSTTML